MQCELELSSFITGSYVVAEIERKNLSYTTV